MFGNGNSRFDQFGRCIPIASSPNPGIAGIVRSGLEMNKKHTSRTSWNITLGRTAALISAVLLSAFHAPPSVAQQTGGQKIRFEIKYKVSKIYASTASYIYCQGYNGGQFRRPFYLGRYYIGNTADGKQHTAIFETRAQPGVTVGAWQCYFISHHTNPANGVGAGSGLPKPAVYRGCLQGTITGGRSYGSAACP